MFFYSSWRCPLRSYCPCYVAISFFAMLSSFVAFDTANFYSVFCTPLKLCSVMHLWMFDMDVVFFMVNFFFSAFEGYGLLIVRSAGLVDLRFCIAASNSQICMFDMHSNNLHSSYSFSVASFNSSVTCTSKSFTKSFHLAYHIKLIDSVKYFTFLSQNNSMSMVWLLRLTAIFF